MSILGLSLGKWNGRQMRKRWLTFHILKNTGCWKRIKFERFFMVSSVSDCIFVYFSIKYKKIPED